MAIVQGWLVQKKHFCRNFSDLNMPRGKIHIIKTGSTFLYLKNRYGDFDQQILSKINIPKSRLRVISVFNTPNYPYKDECAGIIITGSHNMVTENQDWIKNLMSWIREFSILKIPVLGICFGHQLIAQALGGKIDFNTQGIEIGTLPIFCKPCARNDLLFAVMPTSFSTYITHRQSLLIPPKDSLVLASSNREKYQAINFIKNRIWGVQFHPEFNKEIMDYYIDKQSEYIIKSGQDIMVIKNSVKDCPTGKKLLKHFVDICNL